MRRYFIWMVGLVWAVSLPAQQTRLGFQVGFGTSYDYGISVPKLPGFATYGKGQVGAVSFDGFIGIPIGKRLNFYPTFIYSIPMRTTLLQNLDGDYIPEGYSVSLPYSQDNPDEVYSDNYYDLSARAEVWERKIGAFALFHLGGGIELGSGLFQRQKTVTTYAAVLYDVYGYIGSTGTTTDDYIYLDTYTDHVETDAFRDNSLAVPIVLQWRYQGNSFYSGTSLIRWVGADGFWSFRYTIGFHF